jgi:hypothetical protein
MPKFDWYSSDPDQKKIRRIAADKFLSAVLDNTGGIGTAVTGQDPAKKQKAKEEFDRQLQGTTGGGPLPTKVEVICIEANTDKMSDLVVFVLYPKDGTSKTWWRKRWVAAWAPYGGTKKKSNKKKK